jgi:HD-like signal output (HDOD) protein
MPPRKKQATLSGLELRCPPLPQTLVEAMHLVDRPDQLEVEPVTEMVQRDPIVVARLLHIVNSAYYGLRHSINSAERAVVMLGPVAVTGIVVGMNMMRLNSALTAEATQCFARLIRHSIATAFLTRHLLDGPPRTHLYPQQLKASSRLGVSFTAGLLHDFGKIILVYNYPNEAVEFYQKRSLELQISDQDALQLEQLLFGYDHTEAGEFVARKLGFPDLLTNVIRLHHSEGREGHDEMHRVLLATCAANLASKALGFAFGSPLDWEDVSKDPVWDLLAQFDVRRHVSGATLTEEIAGLQEHLEYYVSNMLV